MNNRYVYILAAVLAAVGLLTMLCKIALTGLPLTPGQMATAWAIERQIEFEADGGPVKINLKMPSGTYDKTIISERIVAQRYGQVRGLDGANRILTLATHNVSGPQVVFHTAVVHRSPTLIEPVRAPRPNFSPPTLTRQQSVAAQELLGIAESRSADDATLVSAVLGVLEVGVLADSLTTITGGQSDLASKADAAVTILARRGIVARRVNGIVLSDDSKAEKITHWLEVYLGEFWKPYSVSTGEPRIPDSYLPLWRGSEPMTKISGANLTGETITLRRIQQRLLDQVLAGETPYQAALAKFSLSSLPLATQEVYRMLLVVPLGIFMLVLIRNVIGIKSLGTFMPVLIALALHRTYLIWGVTLFVGIIAAGLLFRLYLEHLKLLLVPRLAAVLIFVIMLMAFLSMLTNAMGFAQGLSVALFPMVIMTMTIERLSVMWDERGAAEAIKQGFASIVIAVLLCIFISFPIFEHLFFTFPELLLLILAATLLLGRYTGYRLLELPRFRAFNN